MTETVRPHKVVNGVNVNLTDAEIAAREAEIKAWQSEYAKIAYIDNRRLAYPGFAEQLDLIYHKGIDEWKLVIKAIKDTYPKPGV